MRRLLPHWLTGVLTFGVMFVALAFWGGLMFMPVMLAKLLVPIPAIRRRMSATLEGIGNRWVGTNQCIYRLLHAPQPLIEDDARLQPGQSYLLVCNHQSWADILILFDLFHGRAPFLRFFLKKELIWVPLIGVICWALDMPFMQRSSRKGIAADRSVRERDLAATRAFCAKYRGHPITVVNFVEGTRCTPAKRTAQGHAYRHLLKPKSAGTSFTLNAMGDQFAGILDVTLAYRDCGGNLLWSWLCGRQAEMAVHVRCLPVPQELVDGNYDSDPAFRKRFQQWLGGLWQEKDARLEAMQARLRAESAVIVA